MIKVYRYVFDLMDSNMYIMIEDDDAIMIDPHFNENAVKLLLHHCVKEVLILLTHEHFDHVSGINAYDMFQTKVIAHDCCRAVLENPNNKINSRFAATFIGADGIVRDKIRRVCAKPIVRHVDQSFYDKLAFVWHDHRVELQATPGHSSGSVCVIIDDEILFTGDSLIPGLDVITRFPGGNRKIYEEVTKKYLFSLNKALMVYPGHGDKKRLGEIL